MGLFAHIRQNPTPTHLKHMGSLQKPILRLFAFCLLMALKATGLETVQENGIGGLTPTLPSADDKLPSLDVARLQTGEPVPKDPAPLAIRLIQCLRTNEFQQAKKAKELSDQFLLRDAFEPAIAISQILPAWRRAQILYYVATRTSELGKKIESDGFFAAALAAQEDLGDPKMEEVRIARVLALAARGEMAQARTELPGVLSGLIRLDTEAKMLSYLPFSELEEAATAFLKTAESAPGTQAKALLILAAALEKNGKSPQAKEVALKAMETAKLKADVETIPLIHEGTRLLGRIKEQASAETWAKICLTYAEKTSKQAWWKSRDLTLAAECLQVAGLKAEAQKVLDTIPSVVASLDIPNYPRGGMAAADAFLLGDKQERFDEAAQHILTGILKHPHYRARAMAAVDVLVGYLKNNRTIPDAVHDSFAQIIRSVEIDPTYLQPAQ